MRRASLCLYSRPAVDEAGPNRLRPSGVEKYGAIAQLGERFNGIEEVVGSIPSGSTNPASVSRSVTPTPGRPVPVGAKTPTLRASDRRNLQSSTLRIHLTRVDGVGKTASSHPEIVE